MTHIPHALVPKVLPPIVGLTGFAQHGKDTVGARLVSKYGYTRYGFADGLRDMALVLNPVIPVEPYYNERLVTLVERDGWELTKRNGEVRRFLQQLGTDAVRDMVDDDIWLNVLWNKVAVERGKHKERQPIVITDVRFINEAASIHIQGGQVWRVERYGECECHSDWCDTCQGGLVPFRGLVPRDHSSEEVMSLPVDVVLYNASTISDLCLSVDEVVEGRDLVAA